MSGESCRENVNTHLSFSDFFPTENRVVYEVIWKDMVDPDRPHVVT